MVRYIYLPNIRTFPTIPRLLKFGVTALECLTNVSYQLRTTRTWYKIDFRKFMRDKTRFTLCKRPSFFRIKYKNKILPLDFNIDVFFSLT